MGETRLLVGTDEAVEFEKYPDEDHQMTGSIPPHCGGICGMDVKLL